MCCEVSLAKSLLTFTCSKLTVETIEKVWIMFKVNNKNIRTISYFTPFSSVSIVDFEQVNARWEVTEWDNFLESHTILL